MANNVQEAFLPNRPAAVLDYLEGQMPVRGTVLSGSVDGDVAMRVRGSGYDLRSLRDYVMGDSIRDIDWKSSAGEADGNLLVREYERSIKPNFYVVTDVLQSRYESMASTQDYYSERNLALGACLSLLQLASKNSMPSTTIGSNDERILPMPPVRSGRSHIIDQALGYKRNSSSQEDLSHLLHAKPETPIERPRLASLLKYAGQRVSNSVVCVVSDFRDADPLDPQYGWKRPLQSLKARNNDILSLTITNPGDFILPEEREHFATEQGVVYVPKGRAGTDQREQYTADALVQANKIDGALRSVQAYQMQLSTTDPQWSRTLAKQLKTAKA